MLRVCGKVWASPEARSPARERGQGEGAQEHVRSGPQGHEAQRSIILLSSDPQANPSPDSPTTVRLTWACLLPSLFSTSRV